jgi:hypothetical protein
MEADPRRVPSLATAKTVLYDDCCYVKCVIT